MAGCAPAPRLRGAEVIADPVAAGRRALSALPHQHLVVHFDVDVLDALDLPLADIATYGTGMRLDHIAPLLETLIADPRVVGMTVVEANPTTTQTEPPSVSWSARWAERSRVR